MLKETNLTLVGQKTPKVVVYKNESQKLCQAFCVKTSEKIVKGQPVAIHTDGTIMPYTGTECYLGIALTDSINPAYQGQRNFPVEVTVMVEGYAIVNAVAEKALSAGYVKPLKKLLNDRFVTYDKSNTSDQTKESKFIALNEAGEQNDLIQVLVR